ncbi:unnamed protein product [Microthlaspi erraticum]|uniref:Integrase catalytic domain-containing protein n=1 Tax=Microthlaspi erraticum TaxID=1685480 RepID=A0A6D2LAT2_9BRAS|nr:unnamed protein product [Microthlaspi erraticum]
MRVEDMIPINDSMPEEQLMAIMILKESFDEKVRLEEVKALRDENLPWYADIVNFMVSGEVPSSFDAYKRRNSSRMLGITIGMTLPVQERTRQHLQEMHAEEDVQGVLEHCHGSAYGGHFATFKTATKVLQSGLWWPTLFKDAADYIAKLHGTFQTSSNGHNYILVAVDYVSKWIEAIPCPTCDAKVVVKLFRTIIFPRFGIPRVVISDGGSHFINKVFEKLMRSHGVNTRSPRLITLKPVGKLKSPTDRSRPYWRRLSPFNLLYGKDCHLPVEVEYKALWAVKMLNFDIKAAQERRVMNLFELEEIRMNAYENSRIYKMRTKAAHDKLIRLKDFKVGDSVLLYNSKLRLFPGKLRSKWAGPFKIHEVLPYGIPHFAQSRGEGIHSEWT